MPTVIFFITIFAMCIFVLMKIKLINIASVIIAALISAIATWILRKVAATPMPYTIPERPEGSCPWCGALDPENCWARGHSPGGYS